MDADEITEEACVDPAEACTDPAAVPRILRPPEMIPPAAGADLIPQQSRTEPTLTPSGAELIPHGSGAVFVPAAAAAGLVTPVRYGPPCDMLPAADNAKEKK